MTEIPLQEFIRVGLLEGRGRQITKSDSLQGGRHRRPQVSTGERCLTGTTQKTSTNYGLSYTQGGPSPGDNLRSSVYS